MKNLKLSLVLFFVLALIGGAFAQRPTSYKLSDVIVTSYSFSNEAMQISFNFDKMVYRANLSNARLYMMRNGKRVPLSKSEATDVIRKGTRMDLTGRLQKNGIIAVLIGIVKPSTRG
ncbi:MAG TPA: hypothetical protein PLH94_10100 [Fimbriimonadaceae bacterium]|nr:hypothetical protein [Fimbriimonadaceae bacterium]